MFLASIPYSTQCISDDDVNAVIQALRSPMLTQGEKVAEFEQALAMFLGVRYVIACNSATSALYVAYRSCLPPASLIITTPISFIATANMLLACQCEPIFVDIDDMGNISPESIASTIASMNDDEKGKLAGIVSVDFAGNSVAVESISALARAHGLKFVSDSSHAFGGSVGGQMIGSFADVSVFSFHAIKPITTAEGGAICTNDKDIYHRAKSLCSHGIYQAENGVDAIEFGFNFRLTELQAALGLSQLAKISQFLARREEIARMYDDAFCDNPYFTPTHPSIPSHHRSTNHLYPILLHPSLWHAKKHIITHMLHQGLGVQVHYKPIFDYALYAKARRTGGKKAYAWYEAEISLPCHQGMSNQQVQYCIESVRKIIAQAVH